ncbi:hypothetical protein R1flu_015589 [Riccia fluitans]|uniref:Uncharacterized protein n=1 Tax=Riccia fluitans TaxID=41844 RepID=A0ABD1YJD1_9MARC
MLKAIGPTGARRSLELQVVGARPSCPSQEAPPSASRNRTLGVFRTAYIQFIRISSSPNLRAEDSICYGWHSMVDTHHMLTSLNLPGEVPFGPRFTSVEMQRAAKYRISVR